MNNEQLKGVVVISAANINALSKIAPQNVIEETSIIEGISRIAHENALLVLKTQTPKLNQVRSLCELFGVDVFTLPTEYDDNSPGWRVGTSRLTRISTDQMNALLQSSSNAKTDSDDFMNLPDIEVTEESIGVIE